MKKEPCKICGKYTVQSDRIYVVCDECWRTHFAKMCKGKTWYRGDEMDVKVREKITYLNRKAKLEAI